MNSESNNNEDGYKGSKTNVDFHSNLLTEKNGLSHFYNLKMRKIEKSLVRVESGKLHHFNALDSLKVLNDSEINLEIGNREVAHSHINNSNINKNNFY